MIPIETIEEKYGLENTIEKVLYKNKSGRIDLSKLKPNQSVVAGDETFYYLLTKK